MKRTISEIQYNRLFTLYKKLNERLNKHFALRRFHQFTKQQQHKLLSRIERIKVQLSLLEKGLKLMGIALVTGTMLCATDANAQFAKAGLEFKVNTYTTNTQQHSSIAMDSLGNYVVVWENFGKEGSSSYGIYAQRYNVSGVAQGSEFQVNTYTTNNQTHPSIAMDNEGDFVITWTSNYQDGYNDGVYAQRYNASGVAQGVEFKVNTYTTFNQNESAVAMDYDGDFVITWVSYDQESSNSKSGVYAQRYNASGVAQGSEFLVNTYTTLQQLHPSIAMDSTGDYVIAYTSQHYYGTPGSYITGDGIYAQRYNSLGAAQGSEFIVNTYTNYSQFTSSHSIAMDNDGDFVITWSSNIEDGNSFGIYAQRYNNIGVAQGSEFKVNTYTFSAQGNSSVTTDYNGDFAIVWESYAQDGSKMGVYAQRYDASGTAQGSEFKVNTHTTNNQLNSAIAMDDKGDFVVTWDSNLQDGSYYGVYAQRYKVGFITAVEGQSSTLIFNLYPNPAKEQVEIDIEGQAIA